MLPVFNSCTNVSFLDQEPVSVVTPENYFTDESQLAAYAINYYSYSSNGVNYNFPQDPIQDDEITDNQASSYPKVTRFSDQYLTPQSGGDWDFNNIRVCNYFFQQVLPKWKASEISGDPDNIAHYIGEMYFLRAYAYFNCLKNLGDFPIVRDVLPDNMQTLTDASKREPRNEVARFILSDLDSAKLLLKQVSPDGAKNRISRPCAQLLSSRVALFEATWEKYFKGTAFVPNGPGWPGATKDYNANYQFPSGSIDGEISFFLNKAMEDSKAVADAFTLTQNTQMLQQDPNDPANPFYNMFADVDMSQYDEVLLWKQYNAGLGVANGFGVELSRGDVNITRSLVDCFLMTNGLPIYATDSGYHGDDSVPAVRQDRDNRLFLFLKQPGQKNILYFTGVTIASDVKPIEPAAAIITIPGIPRYSACGYQIRKGANFSDIAYQYNYNTSGLLVFRAAEAYLNYIEACYEKNGSLDANADKYWKAIRSRAGVDPDYQKTIAATDMSKETNDWGAYSAGQVVDPTLYNIRRERRCELMIEGLRDMDIRRWRSLDQMIATPYHVEGFKFWGPVIQYQYPSAYIVYDQGNANTVSSPGRSLYIRPYEILTSSIVYDGFKWKMAHYLSPIALQHFQITAGDGTDLSKSPIYQNPGWPVEANRPADY